MTGLTYIAAFAVYLFLFAIIVVCVGIIARKYSVNVAVWRRGTAGILILVSVAIFAWNWFVNPLPVDEVMIKHFQQHRGEYEELITGAIAAAKANSIENKALQVWKSDPHVMDLQKSLNAYDESFKDESSRVIGGIRVYTGLGDSKNIVHSMEFHLAGAATWSIRDRSVIWKSYWYFPEAQALTVGKILCPVNSSRQCLGALNIEVLPSLNEYPLFPLIGSYKCGCYARKLDEHWFLESCKACL